MAGRSGPQAPKRPTSPPSTGAPVPRRASISRRLSSATALGISERWSNPAFDEIVKQITVELDQAKRIELYHQAQKILIDEVPYMNYIIMKSCIGVPAKVDGLAVEPDWEQTGFF